MPRFGSAAALLVIGSLGLALVEACTSFSSATPTDDGGAGDASTVADGGVASDASAFADTSSSADSGSPTDAGAAADGAPRTCASCPSGSVCDDGTCLLTPCTGDGGVVLLRPKALVDSSGVLTNHPTTLSTEATLRERGDGDGDQTYVEARVANTSASLKLTSELFTLPAGRTIDSVYLRARSRRTDSASGATIGLVYWFPSANNSVLGQTVPTPVGTGYGVANFYLKAPYIVAPTATWTEQIVNDIQVGVGMSGAATNAGDAAVRLTQVWVEVCLNAQ